MANKNESADVQKRSRVRSPNFPYIGLAEAMDRLSVIYSKDKLATTSAGVMLGHLGYKQAHGSSRRILSALKHYGLLEEKGEGQYRVSSRGYALLHTADNSPQRSELLKEAALEPYTFREVIEEYKGDLPSDGTIKSFLVLKKSFNPDGADVFIKSLRETVEFAKISPADYMQMGQEESGEPSGLPAFLDSFNAFWPPSQKSMQSTGQPASPLPAASDFSQLMAPTNKPDEPALVFKISRDSEARVTFSGAVTQEAIEKLRALLDLTKDTYPRQSELEQVHSRPESRDGAQVGAIEEAAG
jgi:hypothetical protein